MNKDKVKEELSKVSTFKNVTVDENKEKDIFDVYVKIRLPQEDAEDLLEDIDNIKFQYVSCGIFEIEIKIEAAEQVVEDLKEAFNI